MIAEASLVAGFEVLKAAFFRVSGTVLVIYPLIVIAQLMATGAMSAKAPATSPAETMDGDFCEGAKRSVPPTSSKPKSSNVSADMRWKRFASRRSSAATISAAVSLLAAALALAGRSLGFLMAAPTSVASGGQRTGPPSPEVVGQEFPAVGDVGFASAAPLLAGVGSSWGSMQKAAMCLIAAAIAGGFGVRRRRQRRPASFGAATGGVAVASTGAHRVGRLFRSAIASGTSSATAPPTAGATVQTPDSVTRYVAPAPPDQSYWHHVDLHVRDWLDWERRRRSRAPAAGRPADEDTGLFRYVNEMPRGSLQKFEVMPHHEKNAISEDPKGSDRLAAFGRPVPFNYGCLPQTYRDPNKVCDIVSVPGDDDPLDIFDLGEGVVGVGEVVQCRVLGAVCLIDEGQADWKILAVNTQHKGPLSEARSVDDVERISPGRIQECLQWMDDFKQSNSADSARLDFTIYGADTALKLIASDHASWKDLVNNAGMDGRSNGHWIRSPHSRSQALNIPIPVPKPPSRAVPGKILSAPASLVGASREAVLLNAFSQKRAVTLPKEHHCLEEHSPNFQRVTSP